MSSFTETALRSKIERRDEAIKALKKVMKERDERWRQRLLHAPLGGPL